MKNKPSITVRELIKRLIEIDDLDRVVILREDGGEGSSLADIEELNYHPYNRHYGVLSASIQGGLPSLVLNPASYQRPS